MGEKVKIKGTKSGKGIMGRLNYCVECNRGFLSNRNTAMYCGNTCKVKNYRKRLNKALVDEIKKRYGLN